MKLILKSTIIFSNILIFFILNHAEKQNNKFIISPNEFFDSQPKNQHFSYIYAPGMMGTEILMGRYCPSFIASTGEKITWKKGGYIIGQPHSAVIFSETDLKKPNEFTWNPLKILLNGMRRGLFPFIKNFFQNKFDFKIEDNPHSKFSVANYSFNFNEANIGQEKDVKSLSNTYDQHIKKYPQTNIVLFGDSRGSTSIFGFLAKYKYNQIKAAILDGLYDSIPHCLKHFICENKNPLIERFLHSLIGFIYGSYNKNGPFSIDYIENIKSFDIPFLFVTSLKDGLTAPQCAINLYIKLKKSGYRKLHLLILKNALHPCYMIDNDQDRETYEIVVHAFYRYYGLPHNSQRALQGQKEFENTQLSLEKLKSYNFKKCNMCLF